MICIVEPTYGGYDHSPVNAAFIRAIAIAYPRDRIVFASSAVHRGHVEQFGPLPDNVRPVDISVLPSGGLSLRRIAAQWRELRTLIRDFAPDRMILLSSGPETFFAARLAVSAFRGLRLFAILHGNLASATGWRSRDPRYRLLDYRTGLRVAGHERIKLVVLEQCIRDVAAGMGVPHADGFLVWPHPITEGEITADIAERPHDPIRIAFVGAATRRKNFDKFLDLVRAFGNGKANGGGSTRYAFDLVGFQLEDFSDAAALLDMPAKPLARADFVRRLRGIDYAVIPFADTYQLSASGTLLDCISQAKPIISFGFPALQGVVAAFGEVGFTCESMADLERLLASGAALSDSDRYRGFQANLRAAARARTPAVIADVILRDIEGV